MPINYFSELSGVLIDTEVIINSLKQNLSIRKLFINENFSVNSFINKWLITLFAQNFDFSTTNLIWDLLFLEGNIILIKTSILIFLILKKKLMTTPEDEFDNLFFILNDKTKDILWNDPMLIYGLTIKRFNFDIFDIDHERQINTPIIEKKINGRECNNCCNSICNPSWPYCYQLSEYQPSCVCKYLVFTESNDLNSNIIPNYFFSNLHYNYKDEDENKNNILVTRSDHICNINKGMPSIK